MNLQVYGLGYVGTVTAALMADFGHQVIGIDTNLSKVEMINEGKSPVSEPGLEEIVKRQVKKENLKAYTKSPGNFDPDVVLICVGTPSMEDGKADDSQVRAVMDDIRNIKGTFRSNVVVLNRSTCTPDTHMWAQQCLMDANMMFTYVVHPEFLREGMALQDFQSPALLLYGSDKEHEFFTDLSKKMYPAIVSDVYVTGLKEASLVKYASNAFHAAKVTFANEIGILAKEIGADSREVLDILVSDTVLNISGAYLKPGMPFGGSCLPKDLIALQDISRANKIDNPMISSLNTSNKIQLDRVAQKVLESKPKVVTFLGISFKENTDDLRESPFLALAVKLKEQEVQVRIYDPGVDPALFIGANLSAMIESIPELSQIMYKDLNKALEDVDVIVLGHKNLSESLTSSAIKISTKVFDLVGVSKKASSNFENLEGLYW